MYLSRVMIDVNNRQKTKDLTHLGAYHNWVEQSFPDEVEKQSRSRKLWRIDTLRKEKYLIVLSETKPDPAVLVKYGVAGTVLIKSYDNFLNSLKNGQYLRFRLTANPTHSVITPGEKRGRVFPHVTVDQQKDWLIQKTKTTGFQIVKKQENSDHYLFDVVERDHPILKHKNERKVHLSRVSFEGILKITDLEMFKKSLIGGIGRKKAYGMGLMTVIPVKQNEA
ncbi:type I-E CRISPR-associated protein Cas6/Cse3/CasE [Lactobacillus xylocopicola]|uniref:Type I-E CRISPR-associated protein Cas6/Cse3/CasE n=1 Tax=Lactobacillus xylocopicola TaxID=2976676 RepID=A0ABM8BH23_9LACO|nr:type I-E CRISPR-associated protein Cas6/Cse3/CasE [Lactobacillus xylocopicola]BDR60576.1 type I-E CRISPR-associated protein Cas6/Cse3/CasE [Lactobacillus xylocopicola]